MEKEIEISGGSLVFDIKEGKAHLLRAVGNFTELIIPEALKATETESLMPEEGAKIPVISIVKKAFLGKKTLKKVTVPESVERIGDWAFSSCSNLAEISLPGCSMGDSVLLGCRALKSVSYPGLSEDEKRLFAGCIRWEAPVHLSDFSGLGPDWLGKLDAWIKSFLSSSDDEGFQNQILCGEEDYGSSDREAYESRRRKMKASVCMERLLYSERLAEKTKEILSNYVYDHRAGSEHGSESWHALKSEYPDKQHFDLLLDLNCIDDSNRDMMIRELGEDSGELKSLLVKSSGTGASDRFFSSLKI